MAPQTDPFQGFSCTDIYNAGKVALGQDILDMTPTDLGGFRAQDSLRSCIPNLYKAIVVNRYDNIMG